MGQGRGWKHLRHLQNSDGKEHYQTHPYRLPKNKGKHPILRGLNKPNQKQTGTFYQAGR